MVERAWSRRPNRALRVAVPATIGYKVSFGEQLPRRPAPRRPARPSKPRPSLTCMAWSWGVKRENLLVIKNWRVRLRRPAGSGCGLPIMSTAVPDVLESGIRPLEAGTLDAAKAKRGVAPRS